MVFQGEPLLPQLPDLVSSDVVCRSGSAFAQHPARLGKLSQNDA